MKRLLLAACLAVGIHMVLFSIQPRWTPPALLMPQSRSVSISLVEAPKAPSQKPLPQPVAKPKPKPLPKPISKPKPPSVKAPEPETPAVPLPEPEPQPETQMSVPEPAQVDERPPSVQAQPGTSSNNRQGAVIQTSVPRYDINPTPVYPPVALRRGYEGTVMLDVLVSPQGRAMQVTVVQSSGRAILDRRAQTTVQKWLFTPALRGLEPVEMRVRVPIVFQLK